jgi:hypothetical protein
MNPSTNRAANHQAGTLRKLRTDNFNELFHGGQASPKGCDNA